MRFAHVALALAAALSARAAAPAGLTRDEWRQIRRSVKSPALFPHEAQLFGHGDPVGQQGAELGFSAALSGNTLVVGADAQDTPGGVDTGAAYVFVRSGTTWSVQQQLVVVEKLEALYDFVLGRDESDDRASYRVALNKRHAVRVKSSGPGDLARFSAANTRN